MAVLSFVKPFPLFMGPGINFQRRTTSQAFLIQARWDARKAALLLAKAIPAPTNGLAKPKRL